MKQQRKKENLNFIEHGNGDCFDDDQTYGAKAMDDASAIWEQTLAADGSAAISREELDLGFEAIMQRIREEKIEPVTEELYEYRRVAARRNGRKVTSIRNLKRMGILVAAIVGLMAAFSMLAVGDKALNKRAVGIEKNSKLRNSNIYYSYGADLEQAYNDIDEKLSISAIELDYIPKGMTFKQCDIEKGVATIEFEYNGMQVFLKQISYEGREETDNLLSDKENVASLYNAWLDTNIIIIENPLSDGSFEYIAEVDKGQAYYYLYGIMEYEEFVKMVDNLRYYQK